MTNVNMQANQVSQQAPLNSDLTRTIFHRKGMDFFLATAGDRPPEIDNLPPGNYVIQFSPFTGYYLEMIESFPSPGKIYGNAAADADRILNTFKARSKNLGVLMNGLKGSGKTLTSRLVCQKGQELGMPTLLINSAYTGDDFYQFLYKIKQECVVLMDEFEKTYNEEQQASMLTVLDGTYPSKKLFLLTSNDKNKIDQHLINRPGRIHYHFEFNGLDQAFIKEYAEDVLQDKGQLPDLLRVCAAFQPMNMDSLSAIIWEMNQYKETAGKAIRHLNTRPESVTKAYDFWITLPGASKHVDSAFFNRALTYNLVSPSVIKLKTGIPYRLKHIETVFGVSADALNKLLQGTLTPFFDETANAEKIAAEVLEERGKNGKNKKISKNDAFTETELEDQVQESHCYCSIGASVFTEGKTIRTADIGEYRVPLWLDLFKFEPKDLVAMEFASGALTFQNKFGVRLDMLPQAQGQSFNFQDWASAV